MSRNAQRFRETQLEYGHQLSCSRIGQQWKLLRNTASGTITLKIGAPIAMAAEVLDPDSVMGVIENLVQLDFKSPFCYNERESLLRTGLLNCSRKLPAEDKEDLGKDLTLFPPLMVF